MRYLFTGACIAVLIASQSVSGQDLWLDFNSLSQDGGPHPQEGYQSYDAGHEVADDFDTKSYAAFGGSVDFTPTWPDTTDNRVQQMIDRGAGNDANYLGQKLDLVTDFIGIDTRTGNGGNGDYNGVDGTPTSMLFTMSGVPAGEYNYLAYHHDTENVNPFFLIDYSTDGGSNFTNVTGPLDGGAWQGTNSSPGGNPAGNLETGEGGADPATFSSTVSFDFATEGVEDLVIRYTPLSEGGVHRQILGVNGFELSVVPEPTGMTLAFISLLAFGWFRRK